MTVRTCSTNETLAGAPELVNQDCHGEGWILVVRPAAAAGEDLLDATVYAKHPADRAD